ncbi:hypothetical protein H5410_001274 [Solanum commersonii]|uniref:Uncharacterized protein n=1 Tax=Solanum commersonii TaxID=4109 RepID=A0A9J6AY83_SOLCO|nr:hypothetical protein H5410_001274 [Solanum commersonii]
MSKSICSSQTAVSQEVENLSSFNFSILHPDETHLTPICGVGEMGESTTPFTEVVASPIFPFEQILPCFPTLVLFGENSQNSKHNLLRRLLMDPGVSSAMSEIFFEGDLPEGRGPESSILAVGAELVAAQSLTSLRGDIQSNFSELDDISQEHVPLSLEPVFDQTPKSINVETEEEEEEPPLKWNKTGTVGAPDLENVDNPPEVDHIAETTKFDNERQRKGNGKMVVSHSKGDKRKYVTRSETQKVLGSAIAASKAQTERIRKMRREGHEPEQPTSTPLFIGSSATESDDITTYVAKRKKKGEEEREKVKKRTTVKSTRTKRQGSSVGNTGDNEEMSRDARIAHIEKHRVLNERSHLFEPLTPYLHEPEVREFYYKMELLEDGGDQDYYSRCQNSSRCGDTSIILGVPVKRVRSIDGVNLSVGFQQGPPSVDI